MREVAHIAHGALPVSSQVLTSQSERVSWPRRVWGWGVSVLLVGAVLLVCALALGALTHTKPMVVYSDSMQPLFGAGDVVMVRQISVSQAQVGDVITFSDPSRGGEPVTHRLVSKELEGGEWAMITKGDANTGRERWKIATEGVVGEQIATIPAVGYPIAHLQSRQLAIGILVVSVVALAGGMLWRIWR